MNIVTWSLIWPAPATLVILSKLTKSISTHRKESYLLSRPHYHLRSHNERSVLYGSLTLIIPSRSSRHYFKVQCHLMRDKRISYYKILKYNKLRELAKSSVGPWYFSCDFLGPKATRKLAINPNYVYPVYLHQPRPQTWRVQGHPC